MEKNKNLQSGFTLVELIVVMAMMAIIFGALMNVVTPTNKFFTETEAFKDEVVLSEGLTNALAAEVRYATNVVVLQNYVGVPNIKGGKLAGTGDVVFDYALVADNDKTRGAFTNDYESKKNSTIARRKGAKGQILRFEIGALGVNFNVSNMLYSEDFYDKYNYEFSIAGKVDENNRGYIDFGVNMNDMVLDDTGSYVPNEDNYESSEFLYLKNINLNDNDGYQMIVKDFGGSTDDSDYVGYERIEADEGITASTDNQKGMFAKDDSNNVHTWIIYFKGSNVTAGQEVTLTFNPNYKDASGNDKEPVTFKGNVGKPFNQAPPKLPYATDFEYQLSDGHTYMRQFSHWTSSSDQTKEWSNADITAYIPMGDETFTAVYVDTKITYDVLFYNSNGTALLPGGENKVVSHGTKVVPPTVAPDPSKGDTVLWIDMTTGLVVDESEFNFITRDYTVSYMYTNKHTVTFTDEEGNVIATAYAYDGIEFTDIPSVPGKPGYTGKWVPEFGDADEFDITNITDDVNLVPSYTPIEG